jgi:hypothetical protein
MNIHQIKKMAQNKQDKEIKDLLLNYLKMMIALGKELNKIKPNKDIESGIINTFNVLQDI